MSPTILHVDLDAFFCSVEEIRNPDLRGRPFVVGGRPEARGVVSSASYSSREFGIHSAMPTARAVRLCPDLIVLPPRHRMYAEVSAEVMALLRRSAPVVEQMSIDEAFLDVSDDPRPGEMVASRLQTDIKEKFGLPTSWGVASNKLVAKIATQVGKPRGLILVPHGKEADFLAPLPVEALWGVGPKTRERLAELGVQTIGDLASIPEKRLEALFGERGRDLADFARGVDTRPVVAAREAKSISSEQTFARDVDDSTVLRRALRQLSEEVGDRLRKAGLAGSTVRIKVRWPDFTTLTRQTRLAQPASQDEEIFEAARLLFEKVWRTGKAVRLLGVGVLGLGPPLRQLELFDRSWEMDERLMQAIDAIRARYGPQALRRGGSLKEK